MKNYIALVALALCGCSHAVAVKPVAAPVVDSPVTLELARKNEVQAFACSDDLQCLQRLTGYCANGYGGSRPLNAGANKQVGVLFRCITDAEKAEAEAEEQAEREERAAYMMLRKLREEARLAELKQTHADQVAPSQKHIVDPGKQVHVAPKGTAPAHTSSIRTLEVK
jgi:hypothetical protein